VRQIASSQRDRDSNILLFSSHSRTNIIFTIINILKIDLIEKYRFQIKYLTSTTRTVFLHLLSYK
jgi:hypothetical protein